MALTRSRASCRISESQKFLFLPRDLSTVPSITSPCPGTGHVKYAGHMCFTFWQQIFTHTAIEIGVQLLWTRISTIFALTLGSLCGRPWSVKLGVSHVRVASMVALGCCWMPSRCSV